MQTLHIWVPAKHSVTHLQTHVLLKLPEVVVLEDCLAFPSGTEPRKEN